MTFLQQSIAGAVLIAVIALVRAAALHRLPKTTFLVLWAIAVLRLLIPWSPSSALSVYTWVETAVPAEVQQDTVAAAAPEAPAALPVNPVVMEQPQSAAVSPWTLVWLGGAGFCALFFVAAYIRGRRRLSGAVPVEDARAACWLAAQSLRRPLALRQSAQVDGPLTYGLLRPVIVVPEETDWADSRMAYVLAHELVHIRRWDALWKLVLTAAVCVHWFNPLVWLLYVLANRDLELSCDEAVIRHAAGDARAAYARTLIDMEEQKNIPGILYSHFSKNPMEERITAIMKLKKTTLLAALTAVILIAGIAMVFATSAEQSPEAALSEDGGVTLTIESSQDLSALLEEYAPFGLTMEDGLLYYQGQRVREFLDGYRKEGNVISRFSYYDAAGAVDVHTLREDRQNPDGSTELFGPITGLEPSTQEEFDAAPFNGLPSGLTQEATAAESAAGEDDGETFAERFAPYAAYGLEYRTPPAGGMGSLYYNGNLVYQFMDVSPSGGVFTYQSPDGGNWIVSTVYDEAGNLTGLEANEDQGVTAALDRQYQAEISAQWDAVLSPYVPFGLTYSYDESAALNSFGLTMSYQGREVRGIVDPVQGLWITEHAGNSGFDPDAVELYAVYENGVLTGLRAADEAEQAQWDQLRGE